MSALLHVGLHKTGTTSIQTYLREHERELDRIGARFPLGYLQLNNHFELGLGLLRDDRLTPARSRGADWQRPTWRADVIAQVRDDLAKHPDELTVLSCEELSLFRYPDELGRLRRLVGDAEIVIYLRDRHDWLDSLRVQWAIDHARLTDWNPLAITAAESEDPDAYNCPRPDAWILDHKARVKAWRRHFTHVSVFDYDACLELDGSVIPSFCRHLGFDAPDADRYWFNRRGTVNEGRAPGTRWTGGVFGALGPWKLDGRSLEVYLGSSAAGSR